MTEKDKPEPQDLLQTVEFNRRKLLNVIASAPAIAGVAAGTGWGQTQSEARRSASGATQTAYQRKIFDDHQWHMVGVVTDLIIPADERSGSATQAGVPEFIDDWLDFRKKEDGNDLFAAQILGGVMWVDQESMRLFGND